MWGKSPSDTLLTQKAISAEYVEELRRGRVPSLWRKTLLTGMVLLPTPLALVLFVVFFEQTYERVGLSAQGGRPAAGVPAGPAGGRRAASEQRPVGNWHPGPGRRSLPGEHSDPPPARSARSTGTRSRRSDAPEGHNRPAFKPSFLPLFRGSFRVPMNLPVGSANPSQGPRFRI